MLQTVPIRKLVIELRYKPDLGFYGKMDDIALRFAEKFPDWERSPLTVEIRNKKKHRRVFLSHARCFFERDFESEDPYGEFEFASSILEQVCNQLSVKQLQRMGVRQWVAADLGKSFALMVDEVAARFLNQQSDLAEILSDKTTDVAYVVNYETSEGWKYHLRLGPMTRDEWFQRLLYERGMFKRADDDEAVTLEEYRQTIPENFLYIDVDCYQENLSASQLKQRITDFRRRSHELLGRLIEYSKG